MSRPDKSELVNEAMRFRLPSYEAWRMTVPELRDFIAEKQPPEPEPQPEPEPVPVPEPDETPEEA